MTLDPWDLAFRSEWGRDKALNEAINETAMAAHSANRRLSSKLSELEGSFEKRLTALTKAFDAYVELGDVREQLRQLPDARPTLAAVRVALDQLIAGQPATPIDTQLHDHWLAHATNAVAELTEGRPSGASESAAVERSSEAPVFIAMACLALGRGDVLKGRLAALFAGLEELGEVHLLLFRAAAAGRVDAAELTALGQTLQPAIMDSDSWWAWLGTSPDDADGRAAVSSLLDGERPTKGPTPDAKGRKKGADAPEESLDDQLRGTAVALAGAGSDEERLLLARAQFLRERIESPEGVTEVPAVSVPVVEVIQAAIADEAPPGPIRAAMVDWLRPKLAEMVAHWRQLPPPEGVTRTERIDLMTGDRSLGRVKVPVTRDGGEPEALRRAKADLQRMAEPLNPMPWWLGAAGAAVVALICIATLQPGFVTFGVICLAAAGWVGSKGWQKHRDNRLKAEGLTAALKQLSGGLNGVRDEVRAEEQQLADSTVAVREELDALTRRLGQVVSVDVGLGPMFLAATGSPLGHRAAEDADETATDVPAEGPDFLAPEA